jgi:transcriptional regulator with XRE-family HTH domain
MDTFSLNLRTRIAALGLTHAEVARRCDLEVRRFHHYVIGDREPNLQTLVRIAVVLDTTPDILLGVGTSVEPTDACNLLRSRVAAASLTLDQRALQFVMIVIDALISEQRAVAGQQRGGTTSNARPHIVTQKPKQQ